MKRVLGLVAGAAGLVSASSARADAPLAFDGATVGLHGGYGHLHRDADFVNTAVPLSTSGEVLGLDAGLRIDGGRWLHFAVTAAAELQHFNYTPGTSGAEAFRCHIDVDFGTLGLEYSPVPLVFMRGGLGVTVHQKEGCTTGPGSPDNSGTNSGRFVWDVRAGVRYPLTRAVAVELAVAYDHTDFSIPVEQPGGAVLGEVIEPEPVVSVVLGVRFTAGRRATLR